MLFTEFHPLPPFRYAGTLNGKNRKNVPFPFFTSFFSEVTIARKARYSCSRPARGTDEEPFACTVLHPSVYI
jgi:hypothetical protein